MGHGKLNQSISFPNRSVRPASAPIPPLRVMHLLPSLAAGGMENGVVNLCNRFAPDAFGSTICALEQGGALEARLDLRRTGVLLLRRGFGNDPRVPLKLARLLRRCRIDILHTHSWGTLMEGIAAAKLARTPVLIHGEHGTMETRKRNLFIQRWAWRIPHRILAVCSSLADQLSMVVGFPRERIAVIPNGVDTDRFRPADWKSESRRELGLPDGRLLIGMVARLIPVKDHAGVLHALAALRQGGCDIRLALAGDGPLIEELKQLAELLQIADRVHFLGEIDRVERLYKALDVFVSNSHREGMSNTILEAMACGLPVVATGVGAGPELLADGHAGRLVPPRDVAALTATLRELAERPSQRAALGEAARRRAEEHFSIATMVDAYSCLYSALASR